MLRIEELKKTYPSGVQALKGINLDIPTGMFGLLGPNGAGKTTLMKIAATLLEPDSGRVAINGDDLVTHKRAARKILGYLPQEFGLYPTLTAEQTLDYFAKLKGIINDKERRALIDALLERVNLSSASKQKVGGFSGGMRQRMGIAQAIIGEPKLIIVDEPTAGLDPEERARFHNLLAEIAGESGTVILSTHIVSDVSNLCGHMAIIRQGEIIAYCTPQEALDQISGAVWEAAIAREQVPALRSRLRVISQQVFEGRVRLRVYSKDLRPGEEFKLATPTLEDYYFSQASQTVSAQ
ncbi:MAG: multidrug ABC transporter ATP-binding protein [Acidobacteria bacterium 13_1_20CM_3_53_8]|nr:MAG: multidrug ABC transporter ATP-binding protein [Acidobacteria bacterium 13_1_20CM_3_53_8]